MNWHTRVQTSAISLWYKYEDISDIANKSAGNLTTMARIISLHIPSSLSRAPFALPSISTSYL